MARGRCLTASRMMGDRVLATTEGRIAFCNATAAQRAHTILITLRPRAGTQGLAERSKELTALWRAALGGCQMPAANKAANFRCDHSCLSRQNLKHHRRWHYKNPSCFGYFTYCSIKTCPDILHHVILGFVGNQFVVSSVF